MHDFIRAVESGELVIIDGGTGTELERRGASMNKKAWSAQATLTHPFLLSGIHEDYIRAGAEMIIANTYPASRHVLEDAGLGEEFENINRRAVQIAREAADHASRPVAVAGSISTTTFSKSGELDYDRLPDEKAAFDYYLSHAEILAEAGADLIILEMMRDVEQTSYALRAAKETGLPVWAGFSCEPGDGGEVLLYGKSGPLKEAVAAVGSLRPHAVGVMHTQMEHTADSVAAIADRWSGPVFAYPHRGVFEMPNWRFTDTVSPTDFADAAAHWFKAGASVIGGCCGIGPAHIRELSESLPARLRGVC
jgi:S-methylmethionine-dependent homocysteine/selenocysteine methylase